MFRTALTGLLLVAALGGCGDEPNDAEQVAGAFFGALQQRDGAAACSELSSTAREAVESDEKKSCAQALPSLDLEPAEVTGVKVFGTEARVRLGDGSYAFLGRTPSGWRVSAAGCTPAGSGEPFDCELES